MDLTGSGQRWPGSRRRSASNLPHAGRDGTTYTVDSTGVTFTVGSNTMRLQICQADIIRVQYARVLPSRPRLRSRSTPLAYAELLRRRRREHGDDYHGTDECQG